jgi:hypothetical protein
MSFVVVIFYVCLKLLCRSQCLPLTPLFTIRNFAHTPKSSSLGEIFFRFD